MIIKIYTGAIIVNAPFIDGTNERFYKTMRSQPNLTKNSKICKIRLVDRWSLLFYD